MLSITLSDSEIKNEIDRILTFIQTTTAPDKNVVIGVSGGLDSDIATRLCTIAIGKQRIKCFTVISNDMDEAHLDNARKLCEELHIPLIEIPLTDIPEQLIKVLGASDPEFKSDYIIDVMRMRLSVRTVILSMYNEYGYIVVSPSNRTELETGLYMSFGDAIGHIKPIVHLYKTQLRQVAEKIGAQPSVLEQIPSSGLIIGANDIEDIAYWVQNGGPVIGNVTFSQKMNDEAQEIVKQLTFEKLDKVLLGLKANTKNSIIAKESGLAVSLVEKIKTMTLAAKTFKGRLLGKSLL